MCYNNKGGYGLLEGKLKYVLITFILLLMPNIVHAECSYERQAELSRIASNLQFSYEYEMHDNGNPDFTVTINNLTDDIYVVDNYGVVFSGTGEKTQNYLNGAEPKFIVYSNDSDCYGEKLLTSYLNLPKYNWYSQEDICLRNSEYELCAIWYDVSDIAPDQFESLVENYEKSKDNVSVVDENVETQDIEIWELIQQHYYIGFVILGLAILLVVYKRMR